jgi:hypothetical protein
MVGSMVGSWLGLGPDPPVCSLYLLHDYFREFALNLSSINCTEKEGLKDQRHSGILSSVNFNFSGWRRDGYIATDIYISTILLISTSNRPNSKGKNRHVVEKKPWRGASATYVTQISISHQVFRLAGTETLGGRRATPVVSLVSM